MASIKDYIINVEKNEFGVVKKIKGTSTPEYKYSLVLENNTDFVLNRKTKSSDKDLAFIISQNLFYVKDNKKNSVVPLTKSIINEFIKYEFKIDFEKNKWMKRISNNSYHVRDALNELISNKNKVEMYKHEIFDITNDKDAVRFNRDKNLFKALSESSKRGSNCYLFEIMEEVKNEFGYDKAYFLKNELENSNVDFGNLSGFFSYGNYSNNYQECVTLFKKVKEYNIDFDRFLEYILKDSYQQGIKNLSDSRFLSTYFDTIKMQNELYGKIKEKYPKNLKTFHDIIALRYNEYKKYYRENATFDVEKLMDYEREYKDYVFICAKKGLDLIEEGISLSHCVGSYVDGVSEGKYNIFFMRNTETPEESLITIQLNGDKIVQYSGYSNRSLDKNEKIALKKWAKDNKFECEGL